MHGEAVAKPQKMTDHHVPERPIYDDPQVTNYDSSPIPARGKAWTSDGQKKRNVKKNNLSCKDSRRDKKQTNAMKKGMTHESKKRNQKKRQTKFPGSQTMMTQM